MKKKILFIINWTFGLYSFRRELLEETARKYNVYILANDNGFVEEFKKLGCHFIPSFVEGHGTNPLSELKLINFYKRKIKEVHPDIVFTYTIKPNIYAGMACASLGIPYVPNVTGLGTAVENGGIMQKITLPLYKFGLRKARKVFFQNEDNLQFMVGRKIVKCNYELIPGSGVNLDRFHVLDYPNSDVTHFVFIARIIKEKGIDQYLDAARYIRKNHPETRFHICGFCEKQYEEIIDTAKSDGTIIYHGRIENVIEIHKISSCTIHPTYYPEGMSNVLLESAACGRPIITTDRPGCREIIDNGVNGYVVKQKDSQDLIEKIEMFLSLPWEKRCDMGLAGRSKVEQEFDRKIVVRKYLSEIERV